jgi:hypothetical protein
VFPELDAHDGGQALADILAGEVGVLVLEDAPLARKLVDQGGERRAVALLMRATLGGVDRVGEGVDRLVEAGTPLHRDLRLQALLVILRRELDDGGVAHALGGVEVADEVGDAALVEVGDLGDALGLLAAELLNQARTTSLIDERDGQSAIEEGHLLEPARKSGGVVPRGLEDVGVRPEGDGRAVLVGRGALLEWRRGDTVLVGLGPDEAIPLDLDLEACRERVDHGDSNAVKATRH